MTTGKLCCAVVTTLLVAMIGCGNIQDLNQDRNESQASQALTGCELDCPNGQVFTCGQPPCSVTATSLNCNGVITNCPSTVCGNGVLEAGEACDDHNNNSFDRCSPDCLHACAVGRIWCDCTAEHCTTTTQCNLECSL